MMRSNESTRLHGLLQNILNKLDNKIEDSEIEDSDTPNPIDPPGGGTGEEECDKNSFKIKYGYHTVKKCVYENKDENPYPDNPYCVFDDDLNAWINTKFIEDSRLKIEREEFKGVYLDYSG